MSNLTPEQTEQVHRLLRGREPMTAQQEDTMPFDATPLDASEFESELVKAGEKIKGTEEVRGEPIQIISVRFFDKEAKHSPDGVLEPARKVPVAKFISLSGASDGEEHECYLPDRHGPTVQRILESHPGRPLNVRLLKDPVFGGKTMRGWQLCGLDRLPEDDTSKALIEFKS